MSADSAPRKSGFSWILKLLVVLGVLGAAGFFILRALRPVAQVETVISGDAIDAKPGSVTVEPEYSMEMKSELPGRVLKDDFNLDPGRAVKAGDILVQLDTGDVRLDIEQMEANYEAAQGRLKAGSPIALDLENEKTTLANTERLFHMGQVSSTDYEKEKNTVAQIEQKLAADETTKKLDVETDRIALDVKKRQLEKMTIRAPFDGVVSVVDAHPGDLIGPSAPIATLITTSRIVQAKISEEDFGNIAVGQPASVTFLNYGSWIYNGVVQKILPTADPTTQRHLVYIQVNDIEPAKLVPGITGEVSIIVGRHPAKAIVPRRAVFGDNVYVVKDGHIQMRRIKKGFVWERGIEITDGLQAGEQVVVENLESFRDGDEVRVVEIPSDALNLKK